MHSVHRRWLVPMLLVLASGAATATQYSYDELGRLRTATVAADGTAEYIYDDAGSLISVERHPNGTPVLASFSPHFAAPGATVTLYGAGFSAQPSANSVSFNGTPATVTASSAQSLTVTVPAGATSGALQVSVGGLVTTSVEDFTVEPSRTAPTVATLSHACVTPGQWVTVTGTQFDTAPNATRVEISRMLVRANVLSPTSLQVLVPPTLKAGRVRVVTVHGEAESQDLLHTPTAPSDCSHYQPPIAATAGGSNVALTIPALSYGVVHFNGARGDLFSLDGYNFSAPSGTPQLYIKVSAPDMSVLSDTYAGLGMTPTNASYHLDRLPVSGIYTATIYNTRNVSVSLSLAVTQSPTLVAGGSGAAVSAAPGHSVRLAVPGVSGDERVGIGVGPHTLTPSSSMAQLRVYTPDNVLMTPLGRNDSSCRSSGTSPTAPGCHLDLRLNRGEGNYGLIWTPPTNLTATSTATFWLSDDILITPQPGVATPVNITRLGQNARLRVTAAAGDSVSINLGNLTQAASGSSLELTYFTPGGAVLPALHAPVDNLPPNGGLVNLFNLPESGTYEVLIDPWYGTEASMMARLDPGTTLNVGGAAVGLSGNWRGQGYRLVFTGQAGGFYGLGLLNLQTSPSGSTRVRVLALDGTPMLLPDNSMCTNWTVSAPGCELDFGPLPYTGDYILTIEPPGAATTNSLDVRLSQDVGGSLTSGWQTISIGTPGGNAMLSFSGAPGQGRTIELRNINTTTLTAFGVLGTDAGAFSAPLYSSASGSGGTLALPIGDFPITGTYYLFADPRYAGTGSFQVRITDGVLHGDPPTLKSVVPGPWMRATFASADPPLTSFGVNSFSVIGTSPAAATLEVYGPNGKRIVSQSNSTQESCSSNIGGCEFDPKTPLLGGTYQMLLTVASSNDPSKYQGTLHASPDVVYSGTSATFALSERGQNGKLLFAGTAGQKLRVNFTRNSATGGNNGVRVALVHPSGQEFYTFSFHGTSATSYQNLPVLTQSGEHSLLIDPEYGQISNLTFSVVPQ